jgi:epoxide hydrolase 4
MPRWLYLLFSSLLIAAAPPPDPAVVHANANRAGEIGYTEGWFGEGDTRLHYVEAGKGPLVILYHGFPSFWYSWFDQMEALKGRYRVVAVDGLGAGLSGKPGRLEPYRVERLARQLDALARHLNGKRRFVLVGHDWGAALAFAYAQGYPGRLHAVVGLSAPPYNQFLDLVRADPEQQRRSQYMLRFGTLTHSDLAKPGVAARIVEGAYAGLADRADLTTAEMALFRNAVGNADALNGGMNWYRANIASFANSAPAPYWPKRGAPIRAPAMLIWGTADTTFVPAFLDGMPAIAPGIEIVRLDGVGHWTSMEAPGAVNAALSQLLERTRR